MNKKVFLFFVMLILALAACSNNEQNKTSDDEAPIPIDVTLDVSETANVGEEVVLKTSVKQGDESVADADEVEFEVWEDGNKNSSEMIEATNKKDGTYEAKKTFDQDGVFTVQVHVTARGMHSMPKQNITVGDVAHSDENHDSSTEHDHGDHAEGFSMHFMEPSAVEKAKEVTLTVHLQLDNTPLEDARVRYEIWNDAISDKHEYIDANGTSAGEYSTAYTFVETGSYMIKIHVENEDGLHEHEEYEIEVK